MAETLYESQQEPCGRANQMRGGCDWAEGGPLCLPLGRESLQG